MDLDEQMVVVDTPNKQNTNDQIFDLYFNYTNKKKYCVSYLFIAKNGGNQINFLDKLILHIFEALTDLDEIEYKDISNKNKFNILTKNIELGVQINNEISETNESLWEVIFEGDFKFLEAFRTKLLMSVKDLCEKKYCIKDEISDEICVVAYPKVRELENILREFLLRFFSKKFGSKWWKENTNPQLETKLKDRAERAFNGILDMELYSIDFIDLTHLLDARSTQMESHELIEALDILATCRENVDKFNQKIEKIRNRYLGNWKKFFESRIKIENFIKTWKDLYEIRCEVAHNALINLNRFLRLIVLHNQINVQLAKLIDDIRIIKTAEYELLDRVLGSIVRLSKEDVKYLLDKGTIHVTPQNFNEEEISINKFNEFLTSLFDCMNLLGEYTASEIQLNNDDEQTIDPDQPISSISVTLQFSKIFETTKGALLLGLGNSKFA